MGTVFLTGGAALVALATFLPAFRTTAWWVRVFDFPRLQIAAVGAAVLALALAFASPLWLKAALGAVVAGSLAYQAAIIGPYTPLAAQESPAARRAGRGGRIRLLVSNVLMENRDAGALLRYVDEREPDVVLLLEPDGWWEAQFRRIEAAYPHTVKCPLVNTYGMLLYSRLPLSAVEVNFLLLPDVPSFFAVVELPGGERIHLHCLHPLPPHVAVDSTHRDAELVLVGRRVREAGAPAIVAGDLNDVAWSYTTTLFQKISGTLDPRKGRGFYNTFHARWPVARWPLDHLFHTPQFRLAELERLPGMGSDHFPILAELSYEPEGAGAQRPPELSGPDREAAREKLEEAEEEGMR